MENMNIKEKKQMSNEKDAQNVSSNLDIKLILKDYAILVDALIERYIPRVYNAENLEFTLGRPRFRYNEASVNKAIAEPIWDMFDRGGKRWRPALLLMACEAVGGNPDAIKDMAVIPEVVHAGTLAVDDIEDGSELRRGKPCMHKVFGEDIAINAGNTMYFLPLLVLMKNNYSFKEKAYEIYAQEMINVSFGQAMDIAWHNGLADADNIIEEEYLQMCAYKTGTLARMAAKLGALAGGASDEVIEKIGRFAESLGLGFQIQDDILNIVPTEGWGKETGDDINEGKRTLLVIYTLKNSNKRDRLLEILNKHTENNEEIKEAIEIIKESGAIEYAKEFARKIVRKAWAELDPALEENDGKAKLKALADFCVERDI
jgi:geranylgeranyl pyrophosphate synthase